MRPSGRALRAAWLCAALAAPAAADGRCQLLDVPPVLLGRLREVRVPSFGAHLHGSPITLHMGLRCDVDAVYRLRIGLDAPATGAPLDWELRLVHVGPDRIDRPLADLPGGVYAGTARAGRLDDIELRLDPRDLGVPAGRPLPAAFEGALRIELQL